MASAFAMQPAVTSPLSGSLPVAARGFSFWRFGLLALSIGGLWFICCRHLSEEWRFNDQYSYGWFVPFFCAYLFWLRWEDRPQVMPARHRWLATLVIVSSAILLFPLRVFEIANSDYRPLSWLHALAVVAITLALVYLVGGKTWLRHFAFACAFILTAVPWLTMVEGPVIEGLMRGAAAAAAETVSLCGIPAEATGNLVQLPAGAVGVNEACSGVRSLQTSIMIGLLFGELRRLRFAPRVWLLVASVGIALAANFARVLFLVTMASERGVGAIDRYHDAAGYTIVAVVFIGTMWIASRFGSEIAPADDGKTMKHDNSILRWPTAILAALLVWFVAIEVCGESWYRMHERDLTATPAWSVRWPEKRPGFEEIKLDERTQRLLRFDSGREASWLNAYGSRLRDYMFFFRWDPGSGTILRARAHRPDICLPSAGWAQVGDVRNVTFTLPIGPVAFKHFAFGHGDKRFVAHAYYCLREDRLHGAERGREDLYSNWDLADRWRVVKNGIRNLGQQVLQIIVITPASADDAEVNAQISKILNASIVAGQTS